mmetsp:Transcript_14121/g.30413  ORF Transcript_14121/g.30413 Transcript_14121/m.30413 type:complete len:227 (-) Transcript_14121:22-702(-)
MELILLNLQHQLLRLRFPLNIHALTLQHLLHRHRPLPNKRAAVRSAHLLNLQPSLSHTPPAHHLRVSLRSFCCLVLHHHKSKPRHEPQQRGQHAHQREPSQLLQARSLHAPFFLFRRRTALEIIQFGVHQTSLAMITLFVAFRVAIIATTEIGMHVLVLPRVPLLLLVVLNTRTVLRFGCSHCFQTKTRRGVSIQSGLTLAASRISARVSGWDALLLLFQSKRFQP